jgi:hypothetical protein
MSPLRQTVYILFFLITPVQFIACGNASKDHLPPDEFKKILIDMHLADGTVSAKHLSSQIKSDHEVNIYSYVLKKHDISRRDFEKNLDYYSRNTETYLKIYQEIIAELREMDDSIRFPARNEQAEPERDSTNLWTRKTAWALPEEGRTNPITHKLREPEHGLYTLSADIKLFPDDGSVSQRMTILVKYADGTSEENSAGNIKKNGEFENHEVFIRTDPEKELAEITCWVLNHSLGTTDKHANVKNIRLERNDFD